MSSVAIVAVEGVLTGLEDRLPMCDVNLHAAKLVRALNNEWPVVYAVHSTDEETAATWLRAAPIPSPLYIVVQQRERPAQAILEAMGARLDRPALYLAGSPTGFGTLTEQGVSTLLYRRESFVLGDWHQESSWRNEEPNDDTAAFQRSRGGEA